MIKNEDSESNSKNTRRSFLNFILNSSLIVFIISIFYPVVRFLIPPKQTEVKPSYVLAAQIGDLKPNSGKILRFGNKPGILINTAGGELKTFTAICTHLDCTVQYRDDFEHIWCACHNGHYNLNGINIQGLPLRHLTPFKVTIKEDKVFVSN